MCEICSAYYIWMECNYDLIIKKPSNSCTFSELSAEWKDLQSFKWWALVVIEKKYNLWYIFYLTLQADCSCKFFSLWHKLPENLPCEKDKGNQKSYSLNYTSLRLPSLLTSSKLSVFSENISLKNLIFVRNGSSHVEH